MKAVDIARFERPQVTDYQANPRHCVTPLPRVWLLVGDKSGDNAQVDAIEQVLDWPYERKYIHVREPYATAKPRVQASLYHIDASLSAPLQPPWPDLIITIGRRLSMVALWIRQQSGGRTKIVLLGKPSGKLQHYDLIIASAEIQLPPLPNVLAITLPLMRSHTTAIHTAVERWRTRFATLPRPLIALLVGGPTGPFVFDTTVVIRLLKRATEIVGNDGGTPYITTSRRTPPALVDALQAKLPSGAHLFRWTPDATDNPYLGLLGLADGFMVTGDSISMMVEVVRLGKPLAIFPLPLGKLGMLDQFRRSLARRLFAPATEPMPKRNIRQALARAAYHVGLINQTRDFSAFHQLLIQQDLAVHADQAFSPPRGQLPDDLSAVIANIKALMEHR